MAETAIKSPPTRPTFAQELDAFDRLSLKKAQHLITKGGIVVGHVIVYEDGSRTLIDCGVETTHPAQIIGPAPMCNDYTAKVSTQTEFSPDQRRMYEYYGTKSQDTAEDLFFSRGGKVAGYVVAMPGDRRCVIDCGMASWHDGTVTGPLQTRSDPV